MSKNVIIYQHNVVNMSNDAATRQHTFECPPPTPIWSSSRLLRLSCITRSYISGVQWKVRWVNQLVNKFPVYKVGVRQHNSNTVCVVQASKQQDA